MHHMRNLIIVAVVALALAAAIHHPGDLPAIQSAEDVRVSQQIATMRITQLRKFLAERDANCDGCVERAHLIERALEVRGWETADDRIASELTPFQGSAVTHMTSQHVTTPSEEEIASAHLMLAASRSLQCGDVLPNGTRYCLQTAPVAAM